MSKHKPGDVVKIRSWKSMENEYGINLDGDIAMFPRFTRAKAVLCCHTVRLECPPDWLGFYRYKRFVLSDCMFEE